MTPFFGELIGTAILILLGDGVVANVILKHTKGYNSGWIVITMGWALSVFVGVLVVLVIGLSLGGTTGYAINPARDFGPRLMHWLLPIPGKRDSDWGYAWIPIVSPIVGALLAVLVHRLVNTGPGPHPAL